MMDKSIHYGESVSCFFHDLTFIIIKYVVSARCVSNLQDWNNIASVTLWLWFNNINLKKNAIQAFKYNVGFRSAGNNLPSNPFGSS